MRALVVLAVPMLAFGWLTSAQLIQPPADPAETILVFLLPGIAVAGLSASTHADQPTYWLMRAI